MAEQQPVAFLPYGTIVAEVSKNWPDISGDATLLSQRFETVIQANRERGYKLHSWRFSQIPNPALKGCSETIVAVFEKEVSGG